MVLKHLEFIPSAAPEKAARSSFWLGHLVTWLLIIGICSITAWARLQSRHIDTIAVTSETRSVAGQLANRAELILNRASHLTLLGARDDHPYTAQDLLLDGPDNSNVLFVDAAGRVLDSTYLPKGTSIADSALFAQVRQQAGTELAILPVQALEKDGVSMVPLARPIRDAAGNFKGAIVLAIRAGYFTSTEKLYRRINTLFALTDAQGRLVAASEDGTEVTFQDISKETWSQLRRTEKDKFPMVTMSDMAANEPRYVFTTAVGNTGLYALIGMRLSSAEGSTQKVFKVTYIVITFLCICVFATSTLIRRQTRRIRIALATQNAAEAALRKEKEFFAITLGSIEDGVVTLDAEQRITYCNRRAEILTGYQAGDVLGRRVFDVVPLMPREGMDQSEAALEVLRSCSHGSAQLTSRYGVVTSVEFSMTALTHQHGDTCSVLVLHDVSKAAQMAAKLSYQAAHDSLTGLLNRTAFDAKLDAALESATTENRQHVLMFLDLDQFKVVNDSCGHAAGDELLKQVSFLFSQVLRKQDTLARTGGDEFAVLLEDCPVPVALALSDRLRSQLASFRFAFQDKSFQVGVSIGAVEITATTGSRGELMRKADTACYIAKDTGRGRTHMYFDSDEAVVARQGELSWAARLQKALANGEFVLQGQRIVSPHGSECTHYYEMLVRLREDDGTLVPPMAFLPAAERYGLMPALDRAVIERALQMHGELQAKSKHPIKFAVNLSGASLSDSALLEYIEDALARHGVPPSCICFEVTETVAIANLQVAVKLMRGLKELGCTLSLDDFGSGMSSFTYLKQLPVDVVKIDGSFVRNMLTNPVDFAMVEAVNNIAHQMGLLTLAEYVESPELMASLRNLKVDMMQGYGVGRPEGLEQMLLSVQHSRGTCDDECPYCAAQLTRASRKL